MKELLEKAGRQERPSEKVRRVWMFKATGRLFRNNTGKDRETLSPPD